MICAAARPHPKRIRKPHPHYAHAVCRKHLEVYSAETQAFSSAISAMGSRHRVM